MWIGGITCRISTRSVKEINAKFAISIPYFCLSKLNLHNMLRFPYHYFKFRWLLAGTITLIVSHLTTIMKGGRWNLVSKNELLNIKEPNHSFDLERRITSVSYLDNNARGWKLPEYYCSLQALQLCHNMTYVACNQRVSFSVECCSTLTYFPVLQILNVRAELYISELVCALSDFPLPTDPLTSNLSKWCITKIESYWINSQSFIQKSQLPWMLPESPEMCFLIVD